MEKQPSRDATIKTRPKKYHQIHRRTPMRPQQSHRTALMKSHSNAGAPISSKLNGNVLDSFKTQF